MAEDERVPLEEESKEGCWFSCAHRYGWVFTAIASVDKKKEVSLVVTKSSVPHYLWRERSSTSIAMSMALWQLTD